MQLLRIKQNSTQTFMCFSYFSFRVLVPTTAVKLKKYFSKMIFIYMVIGQDVAKYKERKYLPDYVLFSSAN